MNINDKIKQILIERNLTPSYFADEIGVQRSSISHILSGRNRPSFDIIQKIIRRFPDLGYEWIMEEDNQPRNQPSPTNSSGTSSDTRQTSSLARHEQLSSTPYTAPVTTTRQRSELSPTVQTFSLPAETQDAVSLAPVITEKKVEKILIFYTDGSFREYGPSV